MRQAFRAAALVCTLAAPLAGVAADAKQLFIEPVALRGTLGGDPIQMNLRAKEEFADGVEGDYFRFGQSLKVLLAGEIEGEDVFLEESENGTSISGEWNGKLSGDSFSGQWLSADGKESRPFSLRIVRPADTRRTTGAAAAK
ncbi:hypothetical protein NCCP691_11750 [Noviherbaspirillum aridicola]|uniref:Uncharacterized protein n=2 Tax=Noviherbaspirillum aridicola TaxID=2849687 RepID=A0ABQ4Q289_9BURK|nr:hypothetical protein NCCP691_11750 [Noviherbaspirillum aridicola]